MSGISDPGLTQAGFYSDFQGLERLKRQPAGDETIRAVAEQFEALFTQTMLKQMRAAMPEGGIFDSDQSKFYEQMFDQQLATSLSAQGGMGLSEVLVRQLSQNMPKAGLTDAQKGGR